MVLNPTPLGRLPVLSVSRLSFRIRNNINISSSAVRFHYAKANLKDPLSPSPSISSISIAIDKAAQLLSHQAILEKFVHHNPLKSLEHEEFDHALERMQYLDLESNYMSPGERVWNVTGIDPRLREQDALVDLCAVFLDRGASKWTPGFRHYGFLYFFASLEGLGWAPWRRHARTQAQRILQQLGDSKNITADQSKALAEQIIEENLKAVGIPTAEWDDCIRAKLIKVKGWAGMFRRMEHHPEEGPADARISLVEFIAVQSILSRAAIESVAKTGGTWDPDMKSLAEWMAHAPKHRTVQSDYENVRSVSGIAYADQSPHRMVELEASYQVGLLTSIDNNVLNNKQLNKQLNDNNNNNNKSVSLPSPMATIPDMQFIACIDDRMCSLRRYLEETDPSIHVETIGVPGFFGLPVSYKPIDSHVTLGQAPDGAETKSHIVEVEDPKFPGGVEKYVRSRKVAGFLGAMWERLSFSPAGSLVLSALAPLSLGRLFMIGYSPLTLDWFRETFISRLMARPPTDLESRLSGPEAAALVAPIFQSTGLTERLAPLVVVLGHGATSVNNPFSSAYNCGACAGNKGGVNARLFALLSNDPSVRDSLRQHYGIEIPTETLFVGAEHNTTNDTFEFFDEEDVPGTHTGDLARSKDLLEQALGQNALERCRRFLLADHVRTPKAALRHVWQRSVDFAEARPELNHATNASVVVGRRSLTQGLFLDRRAFLPSYDPYSDDDEGTNLEFVLGPALHVCSGINLEYLFSTIANDRYGVGTKAPLNVVSNLGVQQGTYGDLRSGLPSQMVEMHVPVRALFVVDSKPERITAVLRRRPDLEEMVRTKWVKMVARDPDTGDLYRNDNGVFKLNPQEAVVQPGRQWSKKKAWLQFRSHYEHGLTLKNNEDVVYGLATLGMLGSFFGPVHMLGEQAMLNPYGGLVALCATSLSLPILAFSRRYLHGEFMFSRFSILSAGLLLGFNLVATAPTMEQLIAGWGLFGFTSTFLIGSYNDRPTVRNNATFAFAAYRASDFCLLTALAFGGPHAIAEGHANPEFVAGSLLAAALFKSSQFPLTALFARSMEGPTPTSALGYAGLSAHAGVILLASTLDLWYPFDWARAALGANGLYTALYGGFVSKIHADRKGALAYATSATLGLIYATMAAGQIELALLLSLGHASFRTTQVLTAPDAIDQSKRLAAALGQPPFPRVVPDALYRTSWALHRFDTDFHLVNVLHQVYSPVKSTTTKLNLTPAQQWAAKAAGVTIAGIPFTPLSYALEETILELLPTNPALAGSLMATHYCISVLTMRFLFLRALNPSRYQMF